MEKTQERKIFEYSLYLLSRKRYHSVELSKKIRTKYPGMERELKEAIDKLTRLQLINDKEYVRLYIADSILRKPQGRYLISQKLKRKGIPESEVEQQPDLQNIDEYELAKKAIIKKLKTVKPLKPDIECSANCKNQKLKQREKMYRFLSSRGFKPSVISDTINEYI